MSNAWEKGLIEQQADNKAGSCECTGPQNGDMFCPCEMEYQRKEFLDVAEEMPLQERLRFIEGVWDNHEVHDEPAG